MSEEKLNQSMTFGGGQFSEVQIGQAGSNLSQNQQLDQTQGERRLTSTEVIALISQIETLFEHSDFSNAQKEKASNHLKAVKEEAAASEPDKDFALKNLQRATKLLKDVNETATAGQGMWQKLEPIAKELAPWFGVAVKTLLGM